jgi:SsrA-binding protein
MAKNQKTEEKADRNRILLQNRKARHLYEIVETIEVGMELKGSEVKSLRAGTGSIQEAYILPMGTQMFITGMTIPPYEKAAAFAEPAVRERRLLLHRKEIDRLAGAVSAKGMTIVPMKVYLNDRGLVKMQIGLARGKNVVDKRHDIRERDMKRDMQREMRAKDKG